MLVRAHTHTHTRYKYKQTEEFFSFVFLRIFSSAFAEYYFFCFFFPLTCGKGIVERISFRVCIRDTCVWIPDFIIYMQHTFASSCVKWKKMAFPYRAAAWIKQGIKAFSVLEEHKKTYETVANIIIHAFIVLTWSWVGEERWSVKVNSGMRAIKAMSLFLCLMFFPSAFPHCLHRAKLKSTHLKEGISLNTSFSSFA